MNAGAMPLAQAAEISPLEQPLHRQDAARLNFIRLGSRRIITEARAAGVAEAIVERFITVLHAQLTRPELEPQVWAATAALAGQMRIIRCSRIALPALPPMLGTTALGGRLGLAILQARRPHLNLPGAFTPASAAPTGADRLCQPADCHPETEAPAGPQPCGRIFGSAMASAEAN